MISLVLFASFLLTSCLSPVPDSAPANPGPEYELVFSDDFSSVKNGWDQSDVENEGKTSIDTKEGAFHIRVTAKNGLIWANPRGIDIPADVRIEVTTHRVRGDSNNYFGVICRYKDDKNFYFLVISSDGYFGIGKVKNGEYSLINRSDFPPSAAIKQGDQESNRLKVDCRGESLQLSVNDQFLDEQSDSDFKDGGVGLIVGSYDQETEIKFDDFKVLKQKP